MKDKNRTTPPKQGALKVKDDSAANNTKKPPSKQETSLSYFLARSMNSMEANSLYGDTCLHTTVSDLKRCYGLRFERAREKIKNRMGVLVNFTRYQLFTEDSTRAHIVVRILKERRGALREEIA